MPAEPAMAAQRPDAASAEPVGGQARNRRGRPQPQVPRLRAREAIECDDLLAIADIEQWQRGHGSRRWQLAADQEVITISGLGPG